MVLKINKNLNFKYKIQHQHYLQIYKHLEFFLSGNGFVFLISSNHFCKLKKKNLENSELIDNETYAKSFMKKDFIGIFHQQGANLDNLDQNIEFICGGNNRTHQIGIAYLQFHMKVLKADVKKFRITNDIVTNAVIRLVSSDFACSLKETQMETTEGSDLEHNKYVGNVSTIMRISTSRMEVYCHTLIKLLTRKLPLIFPP